MLNVLLTILLAGGCVVDIDGAEYSCSEAKDVFDGCITQGMLVDFQVAYFN